jgi:hypothetical protein
MGAGAGAGQSLKDLRIDAETWGASVLSSEGAGHRRIGVDLPQTAR